MLSSKSHDRQEKIWIILPSRNKYERILFLKHMSSAASTQRASFASIDGKPLNPHISGSSNLFYDANFYFLLKHTHTHTLYLSLICKKNVKPSTGVIRVINQDVLQRIDYNDNSWNQAGYKDAKF